MPQMTIVQAINDALRTEMRRDPTVIVMGEDVGVNGGVFRATENLIKEFGPDRSIDTPLAESGIVGTAIGMALNGLKPVAEIQFDGFMPPAFDHIISHAARIRWRTRGRYYVPLVVRAPYSGGIRSPEHHAESPEAYYAHTPGLKVVIPSNPYDAKGLLLAAIRDPDPVIYLEPKRLYRAFRQEVPEGDYLVPLGKAHSAREGSDVTLIAWGAMMPAALSAAEKIASQDISVEVIDLRTLIPLDSETVLESVKKTGRLVILHEAPKTCGFGSELAALVNDRAFEHLKAPIVRVTGPDTTIPLARLEDYYLPDVGRCVLGIQRVLSY
ncbi:alpha-ketoacid dehydrogenase subunit beta [Candidatus Acetothermia bacterium]|nr:alpha-ketoacid dehydrogenase subunit beta [Candidatus Acetothermia bacterium]MCI2431980.1 alpha-ketoacid dehydrogenase subunit beta [Candidatus Acetothermia bacterium]MCI2437273.1 alpha-ketoacid dehydrogenase subunit beta [Candidatus Acetothermia bacterium]